MRVQHGSRIVRLAMAPVLVVVVMAAWFAPFEIGGRIALDGKLFAARSWQVERSTQGLGAILRDRRDGVTSSLVFQSVERGDVAAFQLVSGVRAGRSVAVGDSIGILGSSLYETLLAEYAGAELVAARTVEAIAAGEKQTLIDETKTRLSGLLRVIEVQQRIVDRMRLLVERAGESVFELETVEAELAALQVEADVARAQIAVLESGGRPEDRQVAAAALEAARRSLEALAHRQDRFVLRTPISGVVTRPLSDSVLVSVTDTTEWVVGAALPVEERGRVRAGQAAIVSTTSGEAYATVLDIEPAVSPFAGPAVVLATLRLDQPLAGSLDGMSVRVALETEPEVLRSWAWRHVKVLFRSDQWLSNRQAR